MSHWNTTTFLCLADITSGTFHPWFVNYLSLLFALLLTISYWNSSKFWFSPWLVKSWFFVKVKIMNVYKEWCQEQQVYWLQFITVVLSKLEFKVYDIILGFSIHDLRIYLKRCCVLFFQWLTETLLNSSGYPSSFFLFFLIIKNLFVCEIERSSYC